MKKSEVEDWRVIKLLNNSFHKSFYVFLANIIFSSYLRELVFVYLWLLKKSEFIRLLFEKYKVVHMYFHTYRLKKRLVDKGSFGKYKVVDVYLHSSGLKNDNL